MDLNVELVGKSVKHIKFGKGVIVKHYDNKVAVDFGSFSKNFLYPDAFESYIEAVDAETKQLVDAKLALFRQHLLEKEREKNVVIARNTYRYNTISHGIFDISEEELPLLADTWEIAAARAGQKSKTQAANIPQKLNMNSLCILTLKEKAEKEDERKIVGLFMPEDDFIGMDCADGRIKAHKNYRIMLACDEPVYFWSLLPEGKRLKSWGTKKMKYISTSIAKQVMSHILAASMNTDQKEEMLEFHSYFCESNLL